MEPTASRFWQVALQSGLMDPLGLQACWDALPPEKRTPDAIDRRLARNAVQSGKLTLWQAQQLVAGRSTGYKIDRYVLLDLLGQGGMGRVYLARDTRLNRLVAIKILSPERVNNPRAIARFHREAMVGAQLQHENLVRIYDEGESNGRCYLVMEYIEGKNIGQMIGEQGRIPIPTAARLARQVALGLEHAQRKGLIHRDVNPYNILVTRDGIAKLTDLGLAIDLSDNERVTRDGATVGTFDYVSPEQARHSHGVDTRSDIYSLGCTLYHMLAGRVPFPSASLPEKLFGHQMQEPEALAGLVPGIPPGLEAVVTRTMRKVPDERFATPLDLAQALEPYAEESAATLAPTAAGPVGNGPLGPDGAPTAATRSTSSGIQTPGAAEAAAAAQPAPASVPPTVPPAAPVGLESPLASFPVMATLREAPTGPPAVSITAVGTTTARAVSASAAPETVPPLIASDSTWATPSVSAPAPVPTAAAPPPPAPPPPPPASPAKAPVARPRSPGLGGVDLAVDLGPEPSLSEGLSTRSRGKGREREKGKETDSAPVAARTRTAPRKRSRSWLAPVSVAVALGVVALGGMLARGLFGFGGGAGSSVSKSGTGAASAEPRASATVGASPVAKPVAKAPVPSGQEVIVVASDGTMALEPDLRAGIRAAIGSRGHVLLMNRRPLQVKAEALTVSGGPLLIRAGEGIQPVIEVVIGKGKPFLLSRSNAPVKLEGVTLVARYVDAGPEPPPLIDSAGGLILDRCAFRVRGAERGPVAGTRAVAVEGGALTVANSWFENFDRALDLAAFSGTSVVLNHCMFVDNRGSVADDATAAAGWAARLRGMPGGAAKAGRKLVMERCTARGRGLIEFSGFSADWPATVELRGCAVSTDALVAWEADRPKGSTEAKPPAPGPDTLSWTGKGNLLDVRGKSWLWVGTREGAPEPLADGPTDRASWAKWVGGGGETAPIEPPLRFATEPSALSEQPTPADFAVVVSQAGGAVGADPARVGPSARPTLAKGDR